MLVLRESLTLSLCNVYNGQIQYKDSIGQGTAIPDLPEVQRVRETQKNISLVETDLHWPILFIPW